MLHECNRIRQWMSRNGRSMSETDYDVMISVFDCNNDGKVDYQEFLLIICHCILREKFIELF